jgi:hypothetical protein
MSSKSFLGASIAALTFFSATHCGEGHLGDASFVQGDGGVSPDGSADAGLVDASGTEADSGSTDGGLAIMLTPGDISARSLKIVLTSRHQQPRVSMKRGCSLGTLARVVSDDHA